MDRKANTGELLQRRYNEPAKGVDRLEPKWQRKGHRDYVFLCHGQTTFPAYWESLNDPFVASGEHGKPVRLLRRKADRKESP